ncbi:MAG: hypothetical protein AAGJ93_17800, partial [Bacteroidota bacterium]
MDILNTIYELDLEDEPLFRSSDYKAYQSNYNPSGSCMVITNEGKEYSIFSPGWAVVLLTKKYTAKNTESRELEEINGQDYLDYFIEGFDEGEQYFENKFGSANDSLYGDNAKNFVHSLRQLYYNDGR